jgi:PQQ-dependent dehydrogenase (methanol/ethanol family)
LLAADSDPANWLAAGQNYEEQRFSRLTRVNTSNVGQLGLAWFADIDTERGQEATPVMVDGRLYVTSAWSMVKAFDARTGRALWAYDPEVDRAKGADACCDVVNRGVAVWGGKVFVGTLDGRLVALDAATGAVVWSKMTVDPAGHYTITGVPRVIRGKVIIGNGGAEYGVRGYVTAYDAATGAQLWRFYTVPGNPALGFEQPELERAARTWNGEWWRLGGGGTVWDGMAFDPRSNLLYVGVGNGTPWNHTLRSPGGGDNLFLSSIVALDPDTGRYVWHYQTTPGESWDHTSTQPLMVADIDWQGARRRVVMQAPKNGFFYVLDAKTGQLLSAEKFAPVNWAERVDLATGRPVENPDARYDATGRPAIVSPSPQGAHNWHPMAFSPETGLVYLPVTENNSGFANPLEFHINSVGYNTGVDSARASTLYDQPGAPPRGPVTSYLLAWNPSTQHEAWRVTNQVFGASGVLATAGGLVFSGNHNGEFAAYDAATGQRLWAMPTQARIVAAASTYEIGGEQYVAVLVGARGLPNGASRTSRVSGNNSRLLVYKLGAHASLPTETVSNADAPRELTPPLLTATNEEVFQGQTVFERTCAGCHGARVISMTTAPDLRYSPALHSAQRWNAVVLGGLLRDRGMASFDPVLEEGESEAILAYVISRANEDKAAEQARRPR